MGDAAEKVGLGPFQAGEVGSFQAEKLRTSGLDSAFLQLGQAGSAKGCGIAMNAVTARVQTTGMQLRVVAPLLSRPSNKSCNPGFPASVAPAVTVAEVLQHQSTHSNFPL